MEKEREEVVSPGRGMSQEGQAPENRRRTPGENWRAGMSETRRDGQAGSSEGGCWVGKSRLVLLALSLKAREKSRPGPAGGPPGRLDRSSSPARAAAAASDQQPADDRVSATPTTCQRSRYDVLKEI